MGVLWDKLYFKIITVHNTSINDIFLIYKLRFQIIFVAIPINMTLLMHIGII